MERFIGSLVVTLLGTTRIHCIHGLTRLGFDKRFKFAMYCSDVSSAFDRVTTLKMLDELNAKRVRDNIVKIFKTWLEIKALVICGNQQTNPIQLKNLIYISRHDVWTLAMESVLRRRKTGHTGARVLGNRTRRRPGHVSNVFLLVLSMSRDRTHQSRD